MNDVTMSGIVYPFAEAPPAGEYVEVADGVLWLRLPLPMALDHVNVYLLDDGDGWTVIDTGLDTKKTRGIWSEVISRALGGRPVKRVVVTHHHPDHVGLAGWFQTEFGAELLTTRTSWLMARMLTLDVQEQATKEQVDFWRRAGMDDEILARRIAERPFNFADAVSHLPLGYTRVGEGDEITMGGRRWVVRVGHGHAPEHATFWSETDNLVLGGDQLLPSISPNLGVYPTEPMADPVKEWLNSCDRFSVHARDHHLVLTGHKLPFNGLPFRLEQLISNHHGALDRLLDHLSTPRSVADCFLPLFKRNIKEGEYGLALVEAVAHVNHLRLSGLVELERVENGTEFWKRK